MPLCDLGFRRTQYELQYTVAVEEGRHFGHHKLL